MADSVNYIVAVVGATASGKTALSVALAKNFDSEIVSFDSMQIYKGMDIASAKPTEDELKSVKHHLISVIDNDVNYSVADYCKDANITVNDILSRNKLPIMVGGTGLYIDSFINNISFSDEETDEELRKELNSKNNVELFNMLKDIDFDYADKLSLNDKKRIVRGLEVYIKTGKTMTEQLALSLKNPPRYTPIYIGIDYKNRENLYNRINMRVDKMLEAGLVEEARQSFEKGKSTTSVQAIGHKELFKYFKGEESLENCIDKLKQSTRRYAKRQLSWFRRNEKIHWFYADEQDFDEIVENATKLIKNEMR
ncbi:MAG: tRNA (adenosine(37)-N6)-dimethylallyltransferase MiaA [Acutalibacteraceae bacterium]|nr:tRNA (adenosine(37)-N6)-dimethylallyltransferase MiaA [Acutalibacteraceae bacterium]